MKFEIIIRKGEELIKFMDGRLSDDLRANERIFQISFKVKEGVRG